MIMHLFRAIFVVSLCGLTACGTIALPQWELDATATATALPPPTATLGPAVAIDASSAQTGRWLWTSFHTNLPAYPPVQLWMDVAADATVQGTLSVYPTPVDIPPNALNLIQQNGCNVTFSSLAEAGIQGVFISSNTARVQITATECAVKYFGPVVLSEPLVGEFVVEYNESVTVALQAAANAPISPVERGKAIFALYCSGCHGAYAEGAPGIPSLHTDQVRGYTDDELLETLRNGRINTVMPAWGAVLSAEDLDGVFQFIRSIDTAIPAN